MGEVVMGCKCKWRKKQLNRLYPGLGDKVEQYIANLKERLRRVK